MHTCLGRVGASVRGIVLALTALIIILMVGSPALAQTQAQPQPSQQQPGSVVNPQPGTITQEHVANPPGKGPAHEAGGEANLKLPNMETVSFLNGSMTGYKLLSFGLIFCGLGGLFGLSFICS